MKKMRFLTRVIPLSGVFAALVACGDMDLFDYDEIGIEGEITPTLTLPVGTGSLTIWDVLDSQDNDYLVVSGDTLVFEYSEPGIIDDMKVEEFFDVNSIDIEFETSPIDLGEWGITLPAPMHVEGIWASTKIGFTDGVEVSELDFWADFKLEIPATDFEYTLEITVDELYMHDGTPFHREIVGVPGKAYSELNNLEFDARFVGEPIFHIEYKIDVPAGEVISGDVHPEMSLSNLDYKFAVGDFSEMEPVSLDPDYFSLGSVDFLEEISGSFRFMEPVVSLKVRNCGIGIPFFADVYMQASNKDGKSAELKFKDGYSAVIPANSDPDKVVTSVVEFNNQNSTIVDFFSLPPTGDVYYEGTLGVVEHEKRDTIWHTASVGIDVDVRVPFVIDAEGMVYNDTINDISVSDVEDIEKGVLKLVMKNSIPLNITLSAISLLDANGAVLTALLPEGDGAILAADGDTPSESTIFFNLDNKDFEQLSKSESLLLGIVVSTDGVATVKSSQVLEFMMVVSAQADLSDFIE